MVVMVMMMVMAAMSFLIIVCMINAVAVFIDGDEPVTSKDEPLAREGWTVFHFAASDITDGEAQATVIDEAVKANIKAAKKPKRKTAAKKN